MVLSESAQKEITDWIHSSFFSLALQRPTAGFLDEALLFFTDDTAFLDRWSKFDLIVDYYCKQVLGDSKTIDIEVQSENISAVNSHQRQFLSGLTNSNGGEFPYIYGIKLPSDAFEIIDEKLSKNERGLGLYGRFAHGLNFGEFMVSWYTAKHLVEKNYLKTFNKLHFVYHPRTAYHTYSRETLEATFPHHFINGMLHGSYAHFILNTAIGENIVHFTHGEPEQLYYGSIPLMGTALLQDTYILDRVPKSLRVPLFLDYFENSAIVKGERTTFNGPDFSGTFSGVVRATIRGIQRLDNKALEVAKSNLYDFNLLAYDAKEVIKPF